ncbi:extracellular exo-polygalacturonase [Stereum hirsutum FP-91666 SS1]|uniref:extracellular exo-polygalacturonase n=1 Tax=Stereum hirsutum (strain FP-91666) TaxID=721885 RepID=UPI000444A80A|nr:extracellular exo-polygalacturonase [Stereum hirsutum FP-91666 SS1]EIM81520.1 extracellular exo-polygalacturonase [Stereum hirsutum FP-91666 SS1]
MIASLALTSLLALPSLFKSVSATPAEPSIAGRATCTVTGAQNAGTDDVPAIEAAIASCSTGTVVLSAGVTYALRSTLDLSECSGCTIAIEGTLKLSDDLDYWEGNQAAILVNGVTGATITSQTSTGLVDGNGVPFWTEFASNSDYARPTLMYIEKSSGITVSNLRFKNAPNVFHSVTGSSTNVIYTGLQLSAVEDDGAVPKNTDGFDVGLSTFVTIHNTTVVNDDDCVAFKSGSSFTTVTDITCTGSHGISVGSLGGGEGSTDTVENIYVNGATMIDSTKAVGIKLYEGGSSHGTATVKNVTFENVVVQGSDYAAQIQSCYDSASAANCTANPSTSSITDVNFINFSGTTSSTYSPTVANLNCPGAGTCDISFTGFTVKNPSGTSTVLCSNIDDSSSLGLTCSGAASG